GIGLRTAQVFAEAGAAVVMNAYIEGERAELERQAQAIVDTGGKAVAVVADVSADAGASAIIAAADKLGGADILVNIAGGLIARVPISDYDAEHFDKVMDANLKTAFNMSSKVLVAMKAKQAGRIINFSPRLPTMVADLAPEPMLHRKRRFGPSPRL
ncbi:SDR family NAD(P)-dependent oxidoreductase, partial [Candidatus Neomarinimicrobiota bacterium]